MKASFPTVAALAALVPLAAPQGSVLVVDQANGPGTDHTTIGAALAAAANGDAILIRSGNYFEGLAVGGLVPSKSLVVSADAGADVRVSQILISGLSAGHTISIRGIDVEPLPQNAFVILEDCAGTSGSRTSRASTASGATAWTSVARARSSSRAAASARASPWRGR